MLKYRLIFGTLMTIVFIALILFDGYLDGSLNPQKISALISVKGTLLAVFLVLLAFPANFELSRLANSAGAKLFLPITITASVLLSTVWYWSQFFADKNRTAALAFALIICFSIFSIFLWQGLRYAAAGAYANCGLSLLSIIYLGALSNFVMAVRIDFGPIAFLMYVFVVKCADIGAYTIGRIFGKHKFSPVISPKKTWEGMIGAVIFAVVISSIIAKIFDIMMFWQAIFFGVIFAFLGQLGDLAESLLKRAAQRKDSSNAVPGFGGVLDVIDSPLAAGVFAYLFFMLIK